MCNEVMARMNFGRTSGVILDACPAHGVWFDRGELDAILDFVGCGGIEAEMSGADVAAEENPSTEAVAAARTLDALVRADRARMWALARKTGNLLVVVAGGIGVVSVREP